jgi:hypothetical protein
MRYPLIVVLVSMCICLFGAVAGAGGAADEGQAPTVSLTTPGAGAIVSGTVSVIAATSDNVGVRYVQFLLDGAVARSDWRFPYSWHWNSTSLADGTHTLQARAYDAAGNVGSSSVVAVTVSNGSPAPPPGDTQAPTVSLTTPAGGATVNGTVSVAAAASDDTGVSNVELLVDGAVAGSDSASPYTWPWDTTNLPDGTHTLAARAYDAAGNVGSSSTITVTVSNAAPTSDGPAAALTGTHWAETADYPQLKSIGYGFAVTNVAPGDIAGAKAKLDAAHNAGIKLIIGLYSFGGPEPYTLNSDGTWTFSQGSIDVIKYLATRQADILAFFGFNEPYWTGPTGNNECGYYSAAQLRQFRTQVQAIWPGAKIYQDIGWPSEWAPGGSFYNAYPCIGNKYADATGVADYVGVWDYPFGSTYDKARALARLSKETGYVINSMHATPVWLAQSFSDGDPFPTSAQILDWNCAVRKALPAGSLISWYVWRQEIYNDTLANHPEDWADTTAAACS